MLRDGDFSCSVGLPEDVLGWSRPGTCVGHPTSWGGLGGGGRAGLWHWPGSAVLGVPV